MKVGDYVRTINGEIYKLIDDFSLIYFQKEQEHGIPEHQIIKSSPNIIDLIEVGDYVNGEKVKSLPLTKCVNGCKKDTFRIVNCIDEDIKSIVTREMFESMEYKVGD